MSPDLKFWFCAGSLFFAMLFGWQIKRGFAEGWTRCGLGWVRRADAPALFWIAMAINGSGALFGVGLVGLIVMKG
ncbi:MAG: hypothetical protein ABW169_00905 [Sphingobium sp.]